MSLPIYRLGWVAGVLDMKGIIIRKRNKGRATPQIVLSVESAQTEIIRGLSELTGTAPEFQQRQEAPVWMRRGCAEHCPAQHVHVHPYGEGYMPAVARWTVTGSAAAVVLHNVIPFLHSDKGWREVYGELMANTVTSGQGWAAVERSLCRLRDLGWDLPTFYEGLLEQPRPSQLALPARPA